jgi:flagellar protein FliO/FliZ
MFEAVFGAEMPLPLRFFIAFLFVLALIGGAAYLLRRFGAGAMNSAALRGRQPRLAVIDAAQIDGRRRLLLIRRDNVEHLIMIGGPSDVVVEPNIVRATPATQTRETPRATGGIAEAMPRALAENSMWPLQPEPAARTARNTAPAEEGATWSAQPEPPAPRASQDGAPRTQNADRLTGLTADLSRGFSEPEPPPRRSAEPKRAIPPTPVITPTEDHNLAEMAHRLESALQRPRPVTDSTHGEPMSRSGDVLSIEPKLARSESKPAVKPAFDSLEQEMASLLGRPTGTGKT